MTQLQVKTINLTPAKIDFNFDELSTILDEQLVKYEGLTFTEKDVADCKKTIAELNKGKKALNDYRLKTKKELSKEIDDFEAKCKQLSSKFDDVIKPLKEQADEFEENRKAEKADKIQEIIDVLLEEEGLNDKFASELQDFPKEYYNKGKTLKSIKEELTVKAQHLGIQQDKEDADQEIIKSHVELINTKHDLHLPESAFISLLGFKDVSDIKAEIESAAQAELDKQKEYEQVPLSSAPKSVSKDELTFIETYEVVGTESQLDALEEFMTREGIEWSAIDD